MIYKIGKGMTGKKHSEETKRKISESHKGKPSGREGKTHTEESKIKMSNVKKGKRLSEETKKKISNSLIGNTYGFQKGHSIGFQKGHIFSNGKNNPFYGKKHTEESKQKMRERVITEETRKRLSKAKKGIKLSEEAKQKVKIGLLNNPFVIHHINGNHFDDRFENRIKITRVEHTKIHNLQGDIGWAKYHKNQLLNLTKFQGGEK